MNNSENTENFWKIRATNYDKLNWVRDEEYINEIVRLADMRATHLALDVGTGSGTIAKAIRPSVRHVVAMDISEAMMKHGDWDGISTLKWDIVEPIFADNIFDRVFARMVFHHILDNLDLAIVRCHDLLRDGGKIIDAEGVPPTDEPYIIDWYTEMFKLKEERRTFTPSMLAHFLEKNGFKNVAYYTYYMDNFSIGNWLKNSGLEKSLRDKITHMHLEADPKIKEAYHMRVKDGDCIVRTKNIIVVGEKNDR